MEFQALPQECIILDACCAINLFHSGHLAEIIATTGKRIAIASYVFEIELLSIDLQPLVDANSITVVSPGTEAEEMAIVDFAQSIDDGEAYTGVLAEHNGWAIASDDVKAMSFFVTRLPRLQVVTTLDFVRHWATIEQIPQEKVRDVLQDIRVKGHYLPSSKHNHYDWWLSHFP